MKTTSHSLMAKGILVLLSLLIMVFIFTYSWFMDPDTPVEASGLSVSVYCPNTDFEYAVGFAPVGVSYQYTNFTNDSSFVLDLEHLTSAVNDQTYNLLRDYNPIDLTGDGVTLIRPALEYGNWKINETSPNYSIAVANEQYISFDLIFRTKVSDTTISLDAKSYAKGNCEQYSGDGRLTGAAPGTSGIGAGNGGLSGVDFNYNPLKIASDPTSNKYGRFSRDAIVGAVRVAFLEYADGPNQDGETILSDTYYSTFKSTPKLLWIPRPDLYLNNGGDDAAESGWTLQTGVTAPISSVSTKALGTVANYSTYVHQYYNIFEDRDENPLGIKTLTASYVKASVVDSSAETNKVTFGTTADLVTLDVAYDSNNDGDMEDTDDWYYGKIHVRIWLEGTDTESRRALAGGQFSISFQVNG